MNTGQTAALLLAGVLLARAVSAQGIDPGGLSPAQTSRVVSAIEDVFDTCREVEVIYRPDCVGRAMQRGASKIGNNPSYWEAEVALTRAARGLMSLVRANEDEEAGSLRAGGYRLKPVKRSDLVGISAKGQQIFARAQQDLDTSSDLERKFFAPIAEQIERRRPWP